MTQTTIVARSVMARRFDIYAAGGDPGPLRATPPLTPDGRSRKPKGKTMRKPKKKRSTNPAMLKLYAARAAALRRAGGTDEAAARAAEQSRQRSAAAAAYMRQLLGGRL